MIIQDTLFRLIKVTVHMQAALQPIVLFCATLSSSGFLFMQAEGQNDPITESHHHVQFGPDENNLVGLLTLL